MISAGTMTGPAVRRTPVRRPSRGAVALGIIGLVVGWLLNMVITGTTGVWLAGEFSGAVSVVNEAGNKLCVTPAGGGADRCSVLFQRPGTGSVTVGQKVRVAVAEIQAGPGTTTEAFILESTSP